jgi:hypothetical protein
MYTAYEARQEGTNKGNFLKGAAAAPLKKKKLGILFYPRPWDPPTSTYWVEQTAPFTTTYVDVALVKTVMVIGALDWARLLRVFFLLV